jgi:hypothetical protein
VWLGQWRGGILYPVRAAREEKIAIAYSAFDDKAGNVYVHVI